MEWAWRFGMIIVSGVPAIVGGGLVWDFSHSWTPVLVWEAVLLCLMGLVIARGDKKGPASQH
ncbi:MAG: hypothetical protein AB7W37_03940 [Syntrophobacteraceae bacterium]